MMLENKRMYEAIIHGARTVVEQKDLLNALNVFPVQDQDTGDNLSALMKSIIAQTKVGSTIDETLESLADAALIGSRGNSGLIFSQFLYGLTKTYEGNPVYPEYITRIESGVAHAYNALNNPVEGTMITLMRKLSDLLKNNTQQTQNIEAFLLNINQQLKSALDNTKNELQVLKKHNVVDAGALGFTLFVEGFAESLLNKVPNTVITDITIQHEMTQVHEHVEDMTYRYCTEVLMLTSTKKENIMNQLKNFGDSLVAGETKRLKRVHIHTNTPEKIVETLRDHGQILETKVDDMRKQYQAIHDTTYDVAILTDSIADLPKTYTDKHPVHIFPIGINFDELIYFDKLTISNQKLFEYIKTSNKYPSSFTPSMKAIEAQINFLLKHYKKLIIVTVSSKMSGIHNLFSKAIAGYKDKDILLIDTKQNSVSEGLIVHEITSWLLAGKTFEEIKADQETLLKKVKIYVHVETLDNMVRSGRIKKSLGLLGKVLRLKPVVSINELGEGIVLSKSLGQRNNIHKIIKLVKHNHKHFGIDKYAIVHVSNLKLAEKNQNRNH